MPETMQHRRWLLPSGDYFRQFRPAASSRGLFLDRDGVLIEDVSYVSDPDAVRLCPGASRLIKDALSKEWTIVIVTNQSGIGRGYYGWREFESVQDRMLSLLKNELACDDPPVHAVVGCPHHKEEGGPGFRNDPMLFRKPEPGMINFALDRLSLDTSRSMLIGDRMSDIEAASNAGLSLSYLIDWHGRRAEKYDNESRSKEPIEIKNEEINIIIQEFGL